MLWTLIANLALWYQFVMAFEKNDTFAIVVYDRQENQ